MTTIDLSADPISLTAALVDIPSVSQDEKVIADIVEKALREQTSGFAILRHGNTVLARTNRGLPTRVILAGHLDTVPIADNVPSHFQTTADGERQLWGCGTVDMKSGDAVFLNLAATVADPVHDLTLIFYDCEEIAAEFNGLGRIERELPEWLEGDLAILGEPSGGWIEAGCQGTLRVRLTTSGVRAHTARAWLGTTPFTGWPRSWSGWPTIGRVRSRSTAAPTARACRRSASRAAWPSNVVPDVASVDVNFRFAPDRTLDQATEHVREVFAGLELDFERTDGAPGALPGLSNPAAKDLIEIVHTHGSGGVRAKYGWTDVSRFAARGIPAVNFGPGDPNLAHKRDEHLPVDQITQVTSMLRSYLTGAKA